MAAYAIVAAAATAATTAAISRTRGRIVSVIDASFVVSGILIKGAAHVQPRERG
jgi:hypothetical protein